MGLITEAVQDDNNGGTDDNSGERASQLIEKINKMGEQYALALPPEHDPAQFLRDAATAVRQSIIKARETGQPSLIECASQSVLGALMTCAQAGLRPGVEDEAYLLPRWSSRYGVYVASYSPTYPGLITLAHRSGAVDLVFGMARYKEDTFHYRYGTDQYLCHEPETTMDDPGPVTEFYGYARLANGCDWFLVWPESKMQTHRHRYAPRNRQGDGVGPWWGTDTYIQMGMIAMVRQVTKQLPRVDLARRAALAADSIRWIKDDRDAETAEVEFEPAYDTTRTADPQPLDVTPGCDEPAPDTDTTRSGEQGPEGA